MSGQPPSAGEQRGVDGLRSAFPGAAGYLDSATYGLPPARAVEALQRGLDRWQRGVARPGEYDDAVDRSREAFAALVGADPSDVAVANQVSVLVGLVAAAVPDGASVLVPEQEFTSLVFPFLVHADRGVTLRSVPLEDLAAAIDGQTHLVAFSAVQSLDGRVADIEAVTQAARHHGVRTLMDATQAAGWLPIQAGRVDYLVAGAYKWLLAPRGSAFLVVARQRREELRPLHAGWYASESPWGAIYGEPLRLSSSARRFDVSPAWLVWLGTAPALETVTAVGVERVHAHDVALANALRQRVGVEPSDSAVVCVPASDAKRLAEAGITAAVRETSVRLAFHLYNDHDDVEAAAAALGG